VIPPGFKPNLAATLTKPELIKFPVWVSPKIDGIRCVVFGGVAYSRSLKPIPNEFVQAWVKSNAKFLDGLDGELVVGDATDPNCMQNSMSVMRKGGEPDFTFYVFDAVLPGCEFWERSDYVFDVACSKARPERATPVPQHLVTAPDSLDALEAEWLAEGYEGMMIRDHCGMYKYGRSTEREGGLVKVKRFVDAEAVIIGFVEEMHNTNEAKKDALGRTERSSEKAGLVGKGTLGAFIVRRTDPFIDATRPPFNIGTGFTAAQRVDFWNRRDELLHQLVTFKHFDHGTVDAPRHPVFKSFRHIEDT
jgi:DNA ligase-1